jgi:uncharacterized protein YbjT (DUF2867 family)
MILVIGGRSKIGSALVGELVARGEAVRALTRSAESAADLPDGVEAAVGDLADPEALQRAMDGADKVFLLSGNHADEVQWHRNAIDAAREAGVGLLVRLSALGSDPSSLSTFLRNHGASDRYLQESGVPYAIVRPNRFLQHVTENIVPAIDPNGSFYGNEGDARLSMVDTRDVAAVALVALSEPGHTGKAFDVTGPEAISSADIAAGLSAVTGREIGFVAIPDEAVRDTLLGFGMDQWLVGAIVDLGAEYRRCGTDGYPARVTGTVRELTGREPRSLDQVLEESMPA